MDYLLIRMSEYEYQEKLERAAHQRFVSEFERAQVAQGVAVTRWQHFKVALGSYLVRLGESLQGKAVARQQSVSQPFQLATAKS